MTQTSIQRHNETVLESLEEGDLVEFPRSFYSHWVVYIGKGKVVHLSGDPDAGSSVNSNPSHVFEICGVKFSKAKVKLDDFFEVAGESKAKKRNDSDKTVRPFDKKTIVNTALSKIGDIGYNILWKNCECFARRCRYGEAWSEQSFNALFAVGALAIGGKLLWDNFGNKKEEK